MKCAFEALKTAPSAALIDGLHCPQLTCPATPVVKGDSLSLSIAAASIIAKVTRDRIMDELALEFPGYGWERNKGYGTREHAAALNERGVTVQHRRSFAPIREALAKAKA
jgi:ribonuclease HII